MLQFYRRLEDSGQEITEEFLWGRLEPLLHYLPPEQVAKVGDRHCSIGNEITLNNGSGYWASIAKGCQDAQPDAVPKWWQPMS